MNFSLYIAQRYVRSKSSQNAVNIINFITFLVIVIGSGALFIVLSGFAGLKNFSLSFSNAIDPDLKALPVAGKFFTVSPEQELQLEEIEGIVSYAKELEDKVYLKHREKTDIAYIKGIDANYIGVTGMDSTLYYGDWITDEVRGVIGRGIVNNLGLSPNNYRNPLEILALKPGKHTLSKQSLGSAVPYNKMSLVLSGVYAFEENLDQKYVFVDLPLVQQLLEKRPDQVSGINFKIDPGIDPVQLREQITTLLGNSVFLRNKQELNGELYRMLNTEQLATYLIFTLVLIIALFNVVGAIIMMILDKQQNSKTLFHMGVTIPTLRRIYFMQGVLVTGLGGLIGVVIGSLLIWSQLAFGWLKITPSLAYPVAYNFMNVLVVLATILVLGIIASKIASSRINKKLITLN